MFFSINSCYDKNSARTNQSKEGKIQFGLRLEDIALQGREGIATGAGVVGSHLDGLGRRKGDVLAFSCLSTFASSSWDSATDI